MTLDLEMAEIAKTFFEECREGLDVMESRLLSLDVKADREIINTIFRAAHSIKGGAATFGFVEVAEFTHGVETLLDEMRNGVRPVTTEAVQALLQCCDCLREMMAATEAGRPLDQSRIKDLNEEITRILALSPGDSQKTNAAPGQAVAAPATGWRIQFEPVADLLRLRNEPVRMFAELANLGALQVHADLSRLPPLDAMDPTACYLAWEIEIAGLIPRQKLDDVFDWVDSRCRLEITSTDERMRPVTASGDPEAGKAEVATCEDPAARAPGPISASAPMDVSTVTSTGGVASAKFITPPPSVAAPADPTRARIPVAQKANVDSGSIRVATEKVDNIINLVGELVITQSMLGRFAERIEPEELDRLRQGLLLLARNTRELQESVMQIRMLPIGFAFNRFPRLVHDLSRKLGKTVELKFAGEGTELDKTVLEKISDPLVHLVRNALDHGLETPERRLAAGKEASGTLELAAFHEGGNIIIEVRDDGAGLNKTKILQKARERGLVSIDQELSDEQIDNLIFMAGFSTADQISDVSGRGVGMDVVRRNINDLGGHVQIFSKQGKGSKIRIRLPLTLAILDGQLVRVGKEIYIISLLSIVETIQVKGSNLNKVAAGTDVYRLRGEYLPVVKLSDQFGIVPDNVHADGGLLIVIEADGKRIGVLVDDLLAQQQVVVKSLESNFRPVMGLAGATILGDGTVALIIDAQGLIRSMQQKSAATVRAA